uniref:Restriction endonuclease beta-beta-alpha-Me family protein n=1 Tax=Clandestinovirus TaxID=2831644 RepID=A0A8F8PR18_9VIRU|nr:restriction endonuclease beta-beta-alpha-Me family protein [Clandestinovirus]
MYTPNDIYKLTNHKSCNACGVNQPLANFQSNVFEEDGFDADCLTCSPLEYRGEYVKYDTEPMPDRRESKFCSKCKFSKPISCFNKDRSRWDGRSTTCKECRCRMRRACRAKENIKISRMMMGKPPVQQPVQIPKQPVAQQSKVQPAVQSRVPISIVINPLPFDVNTMNLYRGK